MIYIGDCMLNANGTLFVIRLDDSGLVGVIVQKPFAQPLYRIYPHWLDLAQFYQTSNQHIVNRFRTSGHGGFNCTLQLIAGRSLFNFTNAFNR